MKLYLYIYLMLESKYLLLLGVEVFNQGLHHVVVVVATPLGYHAFIHSLSIMKGRRKLLINHCLLLGSVMLVTIFLRFGPQRLVNVNRLKCLLRGA
jgi:hypothetical protein